MTPEQMHFFADELREMEKQALLLKTTAMLGKFAPKTLTRAASTEAMETLRNLGRSHRAATDPLEKAMLLKKYKEVHRQWSRSRPRPARRGRPTKWPPDPPPLSPPPSPLSRRITGAARRVGDTTGKAQSNFIAAKAKIDSTLINSGASNAIAGANQALINAGGNVTGVADVVTTAAGGALKNINKVPKMPNGTKKITQMAGEVLQGIGNAT